MMATYEVKVDWNNDGDFNDANEDVSADVNSMSWGRGKDAELDHAQTGILELRVKNATGKYSPENTASVLSPNVLPGRPIRVQAVHLAVTYTLFTGYIEAITPHPESETQDCYILCTDGADRLARIEIEAPAGGVMAAVKLGDNPGPIRHVLDEAGWPSAKRTLDAGVDTLAYWWAHQEEAQTHLWQLEDGERAFMYVDESGNFVYEDRHHRLKGAHLVSQATFSDTMERMTYEMSARSVKNRAIVRGQALKAASTAYIWGTTDTPFIDAGQTREVWVVLAEPATALVVPVATTDWKANTQADGLGTDKTTNVAIAAWGTGATDSIRYGQAAKLRITNNATVPVYIVPGTGAVGAWAGKTLLMTGQELLGETMQARADDATSQTAYGIYVVNMDTLTTAWNDLISYAEWLVARFKNPQPERVVMTLVNGSDALLTQILSRKISDRITVTVTDLGITAKPYYINAMQHQVSNGGKSHEASYTLSRASEEAFWILGTVGFSELGETTKLVF